jgi:hypothetical protein
VSTEHESAPARPSTEQPLLALDGVMLAVLAVAMTAGAVTGRREAVEAAFAAAGAWLLIRLALHPPAPRRRRPAPPARVPAGPRGSVVARVRWALEATPVGYRLGLAGAAIAVLGLMGDVAWHAGFGADGGIARVIAPFHLMLLVGAGLLVTSPLRAAWASSDDEGRLSARQALPVVGGLTLVIALALFAFQWLSAFGDWKPAVTAAGLPPEVRADQAVVQSLQTVVLARIIVTDLILVGPVLLAVRRFRLPFGSVTLMFTLAGTLSAALRGLSLAGSVLAAFAAGLVADMTIRRLRPSATRTAACRVFAVATSLAFAAAYVVALAVVHGRTMPLDLALGAIGLTGLVGLALSAFALPPAAPEAVVEPAPAAIAAEPVVEPAEAPAETLATPPARRRPRDPADLRFAARVTGAAGAREHPVEAAALCALLRGTPGDDVAAAFDPPLATGELAALCRDVVRRHRAWAEQSLGQVDVVYLFLEAVSLPTRPDGTGEQDLLGAWGVTRHGKRVLLGLRTGSRDRATAWGALGADLVERGMHQPVLVVADGAPGVWRVIHELWPDAGMQHCTRSALDEACESLGERERRDLRSRVGTALETARSGSEARHRLEAVVAAFRGAAPARMAVLARRLDRLTAHLAFPVEHRRTLRSATVLQRALAPIKASGQPVGALPGDADAVALVWALLELGARTARRLPMPLHAAAQLDQLRRRHIPTTEASAAPEA